MRVDARVNRGAMGQMKSVVESCGHVPASAAGLFNGSLMVTELRLAGGIECTEFS